LECVYIIPPKKERQRVANRAEAPIPWIRTKRIKVKGCGTSRTDAPRQRDPNTLKKTGTQRHRGKKSGQLKPNIGHTASLCDCILVQNDKRYRVRGVLRPQSKGVKDQRES